MSHSLSSQVYAGRFSLDGLSVVVSNLLHELEDAAAVQVEDEEEREEIDGNEFLEKRTPESATVLNHPCSFPSHLLGTEADKNTPSQHLKTAAAIYVPAHDAPPANSRSSSQSSSNSANSSKRSRTSEVSFFDLRV